jgi:predicted nucleotide-binding protein
MLNMSEPGGQHPSNQTVEGYCMKRLSGAEPEHFKLHMLLCLVCQYRVTQATPLSEGGPPFMRNVFLSHGGPSFVHVRAVSDLLNALDLVPVIAQELPSFGLSVHEKVQGWMRICRSAIVLATADEQLDNENSRTRPNIEHEIGMLQTSSAIQNRVVYLKEPSVHFPSNYAEKVWIPFNRACIQEAFPALITELRGFAL